MLPIVRTINVIGTSSNSPKYDGEATGSYKFSELHIMQAIVIYSFTSTCCNSYKAMPIRHEWKLNIVL